MPQSARHKQKQDHQPGRSIWRTVRLTAIITFVCLAVVAFGFALAESSQAPLGTHTQAATTCTATMVTDAGQSEQWFSINSGSSADVVSAMKCTQMYQNASEGSDPVAYAMQHGTLGTPYLVKPYRSDAGLSQYWVAPVVGANNFPLALLTFLYNPQSHLLHEGEFDAVTGNMFYVNHAFPAVTANSAMASVNTAYHVAAVQGQAPDLIYFPSDLVAVETGKSTWNAGGTSVIDPIWRVPGADGKWRFVDHNGHAHLSTEMPVDPTLPPMPSSTSTQ